MLRTLIVSFKTFISIVILQMQKQWIQRIRPLLDEDADPCDADHGDAEKSAADTPDAASSDAEAPEDEIPTTESKEAYLKTTVED